MAERLVALLRGINVGRSKRVAMVDLRGLLAGLGYTEITTLLNSGNVVFSCPANSAAAAARRIQSAVRSELGVDCAVLTRTAAQLESVVAGNPILDQVTDPARHLIAFLSAAPDASAVAALHRRDFGAETIRVAGAEAYLWCAEGINSSPLFKLDWHRTLGVSATARNWNTVLKLTELASEG